MRVEVVLKKKNGSLEIHEMDLVSPMGDDKSWFWERSDEDEELFYPTEIKVGKSFYKWEGTKNIAGTDTGTYEEMPIKG